MTDFIKLAEAIGYRCEECDHEFRYTWFRPDGLIIDAYTRRDALALVFKPDTDANDDYAVLEWVRSLDYDSNCELIENFWHELPHINKYRIGDYARAALKVIDD